jgi:very-short-patch-repair endonuclease
LRDYDEKEVGRKLYQRLEASLSPDSPPEKYIFKAYYKVLLYEKFEPSKLPALIPQVYSSYDPRTRTELARQRLDFLILFSNQIRVVIEVDGQQHYSDENGANPEKYAEMVAEDRRLKLEGYEVYRIGGYELGSKEAAQQMVTDFFIPLLKKHGINPEIQA